MYLLLKIRNFKPPMLCQFFPVVWNMHIFKGMQVSKFEIPGLAEHSYVTDEDPGMGRHGGDVCRTLAGRDVIWFHSQVTGDFSAAGGDNQCLPLLTALQQLSNSETDSITSTPPWNNNVYPSVSLWASLHADSLHISLQCRTASVQCAWRGDNFQVIIVV